MKSQDGDDLFSVLIFESSIINELGFVLNACDSSGINKFVITIFILIPPCNFNKLLLCVNLVVMTGLLVA